MELVKGSIQDTALNKKIPIAQAFLDSTAMVLVDCSLSMDERDCPGGQQRYQVARGQLVRLQRDMPGQITVVSFSTDARISWGGLPELPSGSTNLVAALELAQKTDGTGIRYIVISDGEPDNSETAIDLARKFKTKIDTIYVGPESGRGREFLQRLAAASGGTAVSQSVRELPELAQTISTLLLSQ